MYNYLKIIILPLLLSVQAATAQWTSSGMNTYTTNNAGNVSVGTNNVPAKFNVYQQTGLGSGVKNVTLLTRVGGLAGTANEFQNGTWLVRNSSGTDWYTARLHDGLSIDASYLNPQVDTRTWWERDPSMDVQSWGTAATTYLTIKSGYVGIGTTNPDERLSVSGTIHSKAVRVDMTGWADDVFHKGYRLRSLSRVKKFILKTHHLPELPSAAEVEKDGQDLGEMNRLLLKKVEELTLYMISLKEENDRQAFAIRKMQQQFKSLKPAKR